MEVKCSRAPGAGSTISQDKALPTGWRSEQLGPHVDIRSGESPSLFSFQTTGIPYFKVEQLNGANKYLSETPYFINVERPVAAGSIIFPKRGASILLNKIRLLRTPGYMDTNLMSLTPREAIYGEYLFYWLGHKGLAQFADVTSIPQINNKHIAPLCVQFPEDTEEQRMIAEALADALIDSLEQLLTKKRQIKQGAMQELLTGKRRLPGFAGLVQTVQLGSVCKMQSGGTPAASQSAYFDGPHPWVAISDITQANKYLSTTERSLSDAGLNASAAQLFPAGTVLYAMYASVGECCIATVTSCTSQAILAMQPTKSLDSEYLYYSLVSSKAKAKSAVQQGTQGNLNKGIVQAMDIRLPEIAEQKAIARVLSEMDAEITALESRLTKARALKQAMAQALLTGRIRLVEPTA